MGLSEGLKNYLIGLLKNLLIPFYSIEGAVVDPFGKFGTTGNLLYLLQQLKLLQIYLNIILNFYRYPDGYQRTFSSFWRSNGNGSVQ